MRLLSGAERRSPGRRGKLPAQAKRNYAICVSSLASVSLSWRRWHNAITVSSFRAALALLIVCPALLQRRCTGAGKQLDARRWAASELARLFCRVYRDGEGEVLETALLYDTSLPLLEIGKKDRKQLPFLALPSIAERIASAGPDGEAVSKAFLARKAFLAAAGTHH